VVDHLLDRVLDWAANRDWFGWSIRGPQFKLVAFLLKEANKSTTWVQLKVGIKMTG
jgi:hypothetical protein